MTNQQPVEELKRFYKSLGGKGELPLEPGDPYYVPIFEDKPLEKKLLKDPIERLRNSINLSESQSVNLMTGFRGNGKSTQLRRLKSLLEQDGCHVIIVDMTEFVLMTKPLEISDFILSLMAAVMEEAKKQQFTDIVKEYWQRLNNFLTADVKLDDIKLDNLALQLKTEPTFKQKIQDALKGHVTELVNDARNYIVELVTAIRKQNNDENKKVVLLVDSVEQIRGVGTDAEEVHNSIVNLFSGHSHNLRFGMLHIVYTVPPYLHPLTPNLARSYSSKETSWPNIHVRHANGDCDENGLAIMREIITKRYEKWGDFFTKPQLNRLAASSGGDVRDFFRLIRESLLSCINAPEDNYKISDAMLDFAEAELRREMLPIAKDDGRWLAQIHSEKDSALETVTELPRLARFLDSNLIMNYLNGESWYDIHPLLVDEISAYSKND